LTFIRDRKSAFFKDVRVKMAIYKVKKLLIKSLRYKKCMKQKIGIDSFQRRKTYIIAIIKIQTYFRM